MPATPSGARVEFLSDRVVKTHHLRTDPIELGRRLAVAAADPAFVPPLDPRLRLSAEGRCVTEWPPVKVVSPADPDLPWAEAGRLLATLHRRPAPDGLAVHGWPARLDRARVRAPAWLAGLGDALAGQIAARSEPGLLVHGDWHLGQLGRWTDGWRLIDIDDVGLGDPAWDLARPAGYWAAGLLDDTSWHAFVGAYRSAHGPAVPPFGDPWPALDLPARVAVFVATVRALGAPEAHSPGTGPALVAACRRMAQ